MHLFESVGQKGIVVIQSSDSGNLLEDHTLPWLAFMRSEKRIRHQLTELSDVGLSLDFMAVHEVSLPPFKTLESLPAPETTSAIIGTLIIVAAVRHV